MTSWRLSDVDEAVASGLASELRLRPVTARVLVSRGFTEAGRIARFLAPRLADLRPPDGIADLDRALDRLAAALGAGETIGVFGDCDVDGVTSAAVLATGLRAFGARVVPRVASRQSGYGLPPGEVDTFVGAGCRLIVTGDCGTSDVAALLRARELGIDVIVIDHHQVPSGERLAYAMINPHQPADRFPFKGLASCGIAFYMMAALRTRLGSTRLDPKELLDLVALGTIADLVPLVEENRILVAQGLRVLGSRKRPGVRALMELAELPDGVPSAEDVSFRLTPRLNAAGRLGDAQIALDLLLATDDAEATRLAATIDDLNRERQRIQEQVWQEALAEAVVWAEAPAVVVGAAGWHHGVVGIIAARLVDRFQRPAVVVAFDGEVGRGSARTTGGVNLYETLSVCAPLLERYGGHAGAAGMTVSSSQMNAFREAFLAEVAAVHHRAGGRAAPEVLVDGILDLAEIDLGLAEELDRLAPFGVENREPVLALPGLTATDTRVVGQGHLRLTVARGRAQGDAIAFNMAEQDPGRGAVVDLIAVADLDTFRGVRRARLRVKHLMRSLPAAATPSP